MVKNCFKIALRNLLRHKVYSFINISGLSLGITCCLLLVLYIRHELSYDKHHQRLNDTALALISTGKSLAISPPIAMMLKRMWCPK